MINKHLWFGAYLIIVTDMHKLYDSGLDSQKS